MTCILGIDKCTNMDGLIFYELDREKFYRGRDIQQKHFTRCCKDMQDAIENGVIKIANYSPKLCISHEYYYYEYMDVYINNCPFCGDEIIINIVREYAQFFNSTEFIKIG
jgi:hypothetical protein